MFVFGVVLFFCRRWFGTGYELLLLCHERSKKFE